MNSLDTLSYAKRLIAVGVPPEQAEVHAMMMAEVLANMASKDDLAAMGQQLKEYVNTQIASVNVQIATVRVEMHKQKAEIIQWMVSLFIAQTGLTIAAIRYLSH